MLNINAFSLVVFGFGQAIAWSIAASVGLDVFDKFLTLLHLTFAAVLLTWLAMRIDTPLLRKVCNWMIGVLLLAWATTAVLTTIYAGATLAMPLRDEWFTAVDRAVGFDWRIWGPALYRQQTATAVMNLIYNCFPALVALPILLFPLLIRGDVAERYLLSYVIAGTCTALIATIAPALSAATHLGPEAVRDSTLQYSTGLGPLILSLRNGTLTRVEEWVGFVSFPSFHTAGSVIAAASLGSIRQLRVAAWLFASCEILGAVWIGGHYLVDIPAGMAVAVFSLWAARRIQQLNPTALVRQTAAQAS